MCVRVYMHSVQGQAGAYCVRLERHTQADGGGLLEGLSHTDTYIYTHTSRKMKSCGLMMTADWDGIGSWLSSFTYVWWVQMRGTNF